MIKHKTTSITGISTIVMLVVVLVVSVIIPAITPSKALATAPDGSSSTPFLIHNCAELQNLATKGVQGGIVYALTGDIDCSMTNPADESFDGGGTWADGKGFAPISQFDGTFDGKGHTISGLFIDRPDEYSVGLFVNAPTLTTNLHIDSTSYIRGGSFVGSIAGAAYYKRIEGVTSAATVTAENGAVGGFWGQSYGNQEVIIRKSAFTGSVTDVSTSHQAGGLIGVAIGGFDISDVYSNATVSGGYVGGLIGDSGQGFCASRVLATSYAAGTLNTNPGGTGFSGGLFGVYQNNCSSSTKQIISVFSAMTKGTGGEIPGGIMGSSGAVQVQIANTFFDQDRISTADCIRSTSTTDVSGCTAVNTDGSDANHFKNTSSVAPFTSAQSWDFTDTWQTTSGFPTLRSFTALTGAGPISNLTVTAHEGARLHVNWDDATEQGSFPIVNYLLQVKRAGDSWDNQFYQSGYNNGSDLINIDTYKPGTELNVRVAAYTAYGYGAWVETTVTTLTPQTHTISNCDELQAIDDNGTDNSLDNYQLTNDIDCSGTSFTPIGADENGWDYEPFYGTFDGQGHTISGLSIEFDSDYAGLFYELNSATIENLKLTDGYVAGAYEVGAIAGEARDVTISNVSSDLDVSGNSYTGGLLGEVYTDNDNVSITNSSSTGNVTGSYANGGLVGEVDAYNGQNAVIANSFATGTIASEGDDYAGGLVGLAYAADSSDDTADAAVTIQDSYATGDVSTDSSSSGGLLGYISLDSNANNAYDSVVSINNSYATGSVSAYTNAGGLVGGADSINANGVLSISNSFAAGRVSQSYEGDNTSFGILGDVDFSIQSGGVLRFDNDYVDWDRVLQAEGFNPDLETAELLNGGVHYVNGEGSQPDYFFGNKVNAPFDMWDFDSTWQVNAGDYPSFIVGQALISSAETGDLIVLSQTGCNTFSDTSASKESGLEVQDAAYSYPVGFAGFTLDGCEEGGSAQVTAVFMGSFNLNQITLRKYDAAHGVFTTLTGANSGLVLTATTYNGHPALRAVYNLVDGGPLDGDGSANGSIVDPVGPALNAAAVPNTGIGKGALKI